MLLFESTFEKIKMIEIFIFHKKYVKPGGKNQHAVISNANTSTME